MSTDYRPLTTEHLSLNSEEFVEESKPLKKPIIGVIGMHGVGSFGCNLHMERELVKAGYEVIPYVHDETGKLPESPKEETFYIKSQPKLEPFEFERRIEYDGSTYYPSNRAKRRKAERDLKKKKRMF